MSSILKALKKLEEEKAGRREEPLDLPREILVARREKRSFAPFAWTAAIIASLLLTIALTLLVTRRTDHQAVARPGGTAAASGQRLETQAEPARRGTASSKPAAQRPAAPPADQPTLPSPAVIKSPPAPVAAVRHEEHSENPALPATAPVPTAQARKPAPLVEKEPIEAGLAVSGIAWNKDSADRLAIINGQPMAIGTAVNGFIVEEILPDRVRFSGSGKTIEILIGKQGKIN